MWPEADLVSLGRGCARDREDPSSPCRQRRVGSRCLEEGPLPETCLMASISPSAGPAPSRSPGPPQPTGLDIFLMPSAALGLADHSHLDTPRLNLLAFKTPASHFCPALGPSGHSLRPLLSLLRGHAARTHGPFSGLHRGPLYCLPGDHIHSRPPPQAPAPACPHPGATGPALSCSSLCVRHVDSPAQHGHSRTPHLPIFVGSTA